MIGPRKTGVNLFGLAKEEQRCLRYTNVRKERKDVVGLKYVKR